MLEDVPRPFRSEQQERQDLINSYEAEEERLTNVLARKLVRLRISYGAYMLMLQCQVLARQEKVDMENELEAESERVMWAMRRTPDGGDVLVDGLRRENEALRVRLAETERDYLQVVRTNDVYREELIELRMRVCSSLFFHPSISSSASSSPFPSTTSSDTRMVRKHSHPLSR